MPQAKRFAWRRRIFSIAAALVFGWMLLLNVLTPYIADDFAFAYAFDTGLRLQSLPQLLRSLAYHYHEWSGRVVVKFFAQGFTMFPKLLFNLCNATAYLGLGLVLYRLARGRRSGRYDWLAFLLIQAALWEVSPAFGQTNLWMCGACNYLWASLGCLAFLLPWRYYTQAPFSARWPMAAGMALAGVLAGWLSENTSAGMLVCLALAIGSLAVRRRRVPVWMWTGFGGAVAGFLLLITARGNYNRASFYSDYENLLTRYAVRFLNCLNMLKEHALPLLFAFAVLFVLLCYQCLERRCAKGLLWPVIFLLGGLAANFAMVLSPDYYERSTHGPFTLITAACAACLVQLEGRSLRRALACGTACLGIVCGIHMLEAGYDIASYSVMYNTRDALLRTEAAAIAPEEAGSTVLESYAIEPYTHWCAAYGLPDIRENTEDSIGLCRARWYGVGGIVATETRTYPFPGHTNAAYEAGEQAALAEQQTAESPAG